MLFSRYKDTTKYLSGETKHRQMSRDVHRGPILITNIHDDEEPCDHHHHIHRSSVCIYVLLVAIITNAGSMLLRFVSALWLCFFTRMSQRQSGEGVTATMTCPIFPKAQQEEHECGTGVCV